MIAQQSARQASLISRFGAYAASACNWLKDLIFPPRCGFCGRVDFRFCDSCLDQLAGLPLALAVKHIDLIDALCATNEQAGILEAAIKSFKYHDAVELSVPLGARLISAVRTVQWPIDAIVPVPLYADRELERGYNQSTLLGQQVALATGIGCETAWLTRIRDTGQQAQLAASERLHNVAGAFQASASVAGKSVLLVDDVVTTGSTLGACANALRAQNATAVYGIALSST